jgi:hypothetical protein
MCCEESECQGRHQSKLQLQHLTMSCDRVYITRRCHVHSLLRGPWEAKAHSPFVPPHTTQT